MAQLGQTISLYQNLNSQNTNIQPVAFSGSYSDLQNTPLISAVGHSGQYIDIFNTPTRVSQFSNDASYAVIGQPVSEFANDKSYTVNGSNVSQFANDKAYTVNGSNVSQFVNDKSYTVNGSNVSQFVNIKSYTINGSNVSQFANDKTYTVNGSKISQFANDSNYAQRGIGVSAFSNDSGYITAAQIPPSSSNVQRTSIDLSGTTIASPGTNTYTWTYPSAFSGTPSVVATTGNSTVITAVQNITSTSVLVVMRNTATVSASPYILNLIAAF